MSQNRTNIASERYNAISVLQSSLAPLPPELAGFAQLSQEEIDIIAVSGCACSPSAYTCSTVHDGCCQANQDG
ncbi:MAG: hypothetical protein HC897_10250 [Thermoanaerobaculia bacterium]|nr:hypothetical protein [Thermoanaerobaculia bacterium]